jgi:hypothetical protein
MRGKRTSARVMKLVDKLVGLLLCMRFDPCRSDGIWRTCAVVTGQERFRRDSQRVLALQMKARSKGCSTGVLPLRGHSLLRRATTVEDAIISQGVWVLSASQGHALGCGGRTQAQIPPPPLNLAFDCVRPESCTPPTLCITRH